MKSIKSILYVSLLIGGFSLFSSCASNTEPATEQVDENTKITYTDAVADDGERYVASLAIEGMSCQMMCGGKIAKTLTALNGVSDTEIEFTEIGEESFANVEYDASVISEKEMIDAVNAIADGIYKVKAVKVTHYKVAAAKKSKEEKQANSFNPEVRYKLPNVFSVLARIF